MPISKREFFRGDISPEDALIDIFDIDRDKAYTLEELKVLAGSFGLKVTIEKLEDMLSSLVNRGWVITREMSGERFYTRRGIGFL